MLVALLAALGTTVGLRPLGWGVGLACGLTIGAALLIGAPRVLGPADLVTVIRTALACGAAALVADSFVQQPSVPALVAVAVLALGLDAVDGWVARRTRTASAFGARFDGETDAFLILVLSVYVAHALAGWVLLIGAARYLFAAAGWWFPWLRQQLPPRYWRKVVTATQGVVLTVAAASVAPDWLVHAALAVALVLLTESFGRDVLWSWHHGSPQPAPVAEKPARPDRRRP